MDGETVACDMEQEKDDGVATDNQGDPLLDSQGEALSPAGVEPETEATSAEDEENSWGWMVTFAIFMNYTLYSGYTKSSGLIFVELLHRYNASNTETTLLFAVRSGVQCIVAFYVMNVLLERVQARTLVLLGGTCMALSAITSAFANHLTLFICLQSFLLAIGKGMLISPGHVLLGRYFHRRLAVALCLSECGVSVGGLLVPPLVSHLLHEYALPGALLIYGGLCLNSLPAGLLHRPVSNVPHPKSSTISDPKSSGGKVPSAIVSGSKSTPKPLEWQESVVRISLSMSSVYSSNAQLNRSRNESRSLNPESTHDGQLRKSAMVLLERSRSFFSILDFSLFRSPLFCLLLCMCVNCYVVDFVLDYLPALVDEHGLTESEAALLVSIISGLGLLCRLACVFLQNLRLVRATTLALVANLILGVTLQFVGFMTSFEQYLVLAVVDGFLGSVANCLFPVLVIEFVGIDNMAKGISLIHLFAGLNTALYVLMGYIRDVSGSYVYVFHVIGGCLIMSALLLACEGPVRRFENRRELAKTKDASVKRSSETAHAEE